MTKARITPTAEAAKRGVPPVVAPIDVPLRVSPLLWLRQGQGLASGGTVKPPRIKPKNVRDYPKR